MRRMAAALSIASVVLVLVAWPAVATADPSDDPCPLAMAFVYRFVPIAPNLEGDIDLTQQHPPTDPNTPMPDLPPQTDIICANGCV